MAKVFTIAPGLENMGALKTGGQGSVYRGRRVGEITTAIKILPTPIFAENESDKNFKDFQNEVAKLKRVNEEPNANVVKILSSGLSETGNFPYIEMEFIEGPDLAELLKAPNDPVFTIKEVIKVAEQLSNALAHCHKLDVKHGDIKSNNIKFSIHSSNYVLLDFGLAIMSDEQRRTSLRKAGAVEFMAPEQNEGVMLFQTDIYSFGIVMYEILAGQVPFPLEEKGETSRNIVRLSHMESPVPDVLAIRKQNLPTGWSEEKRELEMQVPDWLLSMIYKCLEKKPEQRFANGIELHDYVVHHGTHGLPYILQGKTAPQAPPPVDVDELIKEKENLERQLLDYKKQLDKRNKEFEEAKARVIQLQTSQRENAPVLQPLVNETREENTGISKSAFYTLLLVTVGLAILSIFLFTRSGKNENDIAGETTTTSQPNDTTTTTVSHTSTPATTVTMVAQQHPATINKDSLRRERIKRQKSIDSLKALQQQAVVQPTADNNPPAQNGEEDDEDAELNKTNFTGGKFRPVTFAYFYSKPDLNTIRKAFINQWNEPVTALADKNGFIYVSYKNDDGVVTKGWLRKKDLIKATD